MAPRAHLETHSFGLVTSPRELHLEQSLCRFFDLGAFSKTVNIEFEGRCITAPVHATDTVFSVVLRELGALSGFRVKSRSKWIGLGDRLLPMLTETFQVSRHGIMTFSQTATHGKVRRNKDRKITGFAATCFPCAPCAPHADQVILPVCHTSESLTATVSGTPFAIGNPQEHLAHVVTGYSTSVPPSFILCANASSRRCVSNMHDSSVEFIDRTKSCTDISWLNTLDSATNSTFDGALPLGENRQKDGQEAQPVTQIRRPGVQTHYAFSAYSCDAEDQGTLPTCIAMVSWKLARFCSRKRLENYLHSPVVPVCGEIAEEIHDDPTLNQSACFDLQSMPLLPFCSRLCISTGDPEHESPNMGIRHSQFPLADASFADPIHGEHACHAFPAFQCDAENLDSTGIGDIVVPQAFAWFGGRGQSAPAGCFAA